MVISDVDVLEILSRNSLKLLESFSMKESTNKELTILAVENLLDSCQNLKFLTELR